jgi:4-hydroxybenzoate polyprenyltransferase
MRHGRIPSVGQRTRRSTARGLVAACHVQPTVALTGFTAALAVAAGCGRKCLTVGAAALTGQLVIGWSNDFWDRSIDARAGRLDKPIVTGSVSADVVRNGAIVAAAACVPLSLLCGRRAASAHLVLVGSGLAYNAKLKNTPLSVAPYLVAFGALPAFAALSADRRRLPRTNTMIVAALLGAGAHFINVLPDTEADAITGVRGLPQRLGPTRSLYAGASLLTASAVLVAAFGRHPSTSLQRTLLTTCGAAVAAVIASARTGRQRLAQSMSLIAAASTVMFYVTQALVKTGTGDAAGRAEHVMLAAGSVVDAAAHARP